MLNSDLTSVKKAEFPEDLKSLLIDFNKKFNEAYDARLKVIDYLVDNYDYDENDYSLTEDECNFVLGLDENGIREIISERSNA